MNIPQYSSDKYIKSNYFNARKRCLFGKVAMHLHDFYELELIIDGEGIYNIDGINYPIESNRIFLMSPRSFHHVNFTKETNFINLVFTAENCDFNFLEALFLDKTYVSLKLDEDSALFISAVLNELAKSAKNENETQIQYFSHLINSILGKICNLTDKNKNFDLEIPFIKAIVYIQNNYTENISLEDVAKLANYNPNYFSNKFKSYMGTTFKKYIADLRFSFAKSLLKNTDLSVIQICYKCGFNDFTNFLCQFKNKYGTTPKKYRQEKKFNP